MNGGDLEIQNLCKKIEESINKNKTKQIIWIKNPKFLN